MNQFGSYNYNGNPLDGLPLNYNIANFPYKGSNNIANRYTEDFLVDGNYSTPYNHDDLFIWPSDLVFGSTTSWPSVVVADSTSPTGEYMSFAPNANFTQFAQFAAQGIAGNSLVVGTNLPDTKLQFSASIKCPSGTTSFTILTGTFGGTDSSNTFSCTTSYQTYNWTQIENPLDVGKYMQIKNTGTTGFYAAWIDIVPWTLFNGVPLGGSGAAVVTGPANSTNAGHVVTEVGTDGTIQDGGKAIGGAGTAIVTGPNSGTAASHLTCYADTVGTVQDCSNSASPTIAYSGGTLEPVIQSTANSGLLDLKSNSTSSYTVYTVYGGSTRYWYWGLCTSTNYCLVDSVGNHSIFNIPSNTVPANSLGGNANGLTTITQAASDNTTNIATDAFVKANRPLTGTTGSIGGAALAAGQCASGTVSVTGATTNMAVVATPVTYPGDGMAWRPYISSWGVVTFRVCGDVAGSPTASTYNVRVIP